MIVQCDCAYLRRLERVCTHARTNARTHARTHTRKHARTHVRISYSDLCLTFVFSTLRVFCSFCALVMFLCFFFFFFLLIYPFLSALLLLWTFFPETSVRVTVFSCACDRVFKHLVTVIVRLGTVVMCKCKCVNEFRVNYWLTSIFGLCVIPGFFT